MEQYEEMKSLRDNLQNYDAKQVELEATIEDLLMENKSQKS